MNLTVERWWSESRLGNLLVHEPRLCLYEYTDQGDVLIDSVPLSDIFEAWEDWQQNQDDFGL